MDKLVKDVSNNFIDELANKNNVVIEVGARHTGKTLFSMSVLSHCIKNKLFDSYFLVLPTYRYQRHNTFRWLEHLDDKDQQKITIFETFGLFIIDDLINNRKKNGNTFFMIDDATSFLELFHSNASLRKLIIESRHLSITTWLISHSLKSTINNLIRTNTSYYLLHKQSNAAFLTSLWEENLSLFIKKNDFMDLCRDRMINDSYVCIVIDSDRSILDDKAMDWTFIKKQRELILKSNNTVYPKNVTDKKADKTRPISTKSKNRPGILRLPKIAGK